MMELGDRDGAHETFEKAVNEITEKGTGHRLGRYVRQQFSSAPTLVEIRANLKDFNSALRTIDEIPMIGREALSRRGFIVLGPPQRVVPDGHKDRLNRSSQILGLRI
jgi:hypothetical protein